MDPNQTRGLEAVAPINRWGGLLFCGPSRGSGSPRPPPRGITSPWFEVTCSVTMLQVWLLRGLLMPNPEQAANAAFLLLGARTEAGGQGDPGHREPGDRACTPPWTGSASLPMCGLRGQGSEHSLIYVLQMRQVYIEICFFLRHPPDCSRPWAGPAEGGSARRSGWVGSSLSSGAQRPPNKVPSGLFVKNKKRVEG